MIRSGAGFHIIKLIERENASKASLRNSVRHILLRTSPQQDTKTVMERMLDIRRQILDGQASFPQMARQYSKTAARCAAATWAGRHPPICA